MLYASGRLAILEGLARVIAPDNTVEIQASSGSPMSRLKQPSIALQLDGFRSDRLRLNRSDALFAKRHDRIYKYTVADMDEGGKRLGPPEKSAS